MEHNLSIEPGHCTGECLPLARDVYERASHIASQSAINRDEISKRFQFVTDVAATDTHKQAEILLEHALALYELINGQEAPSVAQLMLRLASTYAVHGKADSAEFMTRWAQEILQAPKNEPTHEFFHLFGMDRPDDTSKGNA
jgi:hypothetical protein